VEVVSNLIKQTAVITEAYLLCQLLTFFPTSCSQG